MVTMTLVGVPATPHPSPEVFNLIFRRRSIAGSMIGGIPETQEMLGLLRRTRHRRRYRTDPRR
ncbi:hypothetical protein LNQ03_18150 [Klebsiella pneumoniae subsp. pneumoniae]|nr:hypothetical protein [Klebsiella pneumoniae subsp. pneumoniae]